MTREVIIAALRHCLLAHGGTGFCDECPAGDVERTGDTCPVYLEALGVLEGLYSARLLTADEFAAAEAGAGWIETWLRGEDGDPDEMSMERCAWAGPYMAFAESCNGEKANVLAEYNRPYGCRVWTGERPTEEQREAVKWDD